MRLIVLDLLNQLRLRERLLQRLNHISLLPENGLASFVDVLQ